MTLLITSPGATELLLLGITSFIFGIMITRWLFRINTIAENLTMQTRLLAKMAKKAGVSDDEIRDVLGFRPKQ